MALHYKSISLGEKGMRVIRNPLVRLVVAISMLLLSTTLAHYLTELVMWLVGSEPFEYFKMIIGVIFLCASSILLYHIYVALFEGRETSELSISKMVPQLGLGLILGALFISIIIFTMHLFGSYEINGKNSAVVLIPVFFMALQAGIFEELLTRGALFRIVEDGLGTWISIIISAFVFGFLHIWNPNATVFSSISIAITAGVILALFYVITRKLWIPIGIHIAWNFTLGGIYGAPVSGGAQNGLFVSQSSGSDLITGGDFGPEASIISIILFTLIGFILAYMAIKKGAIKKPFWLK